MIELLQAVDGMEPGSYGHLSPADEARLICAGLARAVDGPVPVLSHRQINAFNYGQLLVPSGGSITFERQPSIRLTGSGLVKTGPCKLYAIGCRNAADAEGTITVYNSTTASGVKVLDAVTLTHGFLQFGPTGELLSNGCYVVLSNAAARPTVLIE